VSRYLNLYRTISSTFGTRLRPIGTFAALQVREGISAATMAADNVLFPAVKTQPIDRPIFIVGNPRSGTTFLHRLLLNAGDMAAFELWEMMFPAITARKLLGRIVPRIDRLNPARYHPSDVHDTNLRGIETDDVAWFLRTLDGPFAWAYFLAWQDHWGSALSKQEMGISGVSEAEKDRFFGYHEAIWRRNLVYKKAKRVLAKTSMLTFRIEEVLQRYPDAKLVYIIRDPVEVIPSGMSLIAGVLENGYDAFNKTSPADQQRWVENLYQASGDLLRTFYEAQTSGAIPEKNLCVVRYTDLLHNLEPTMKRILDFIEIEPPQAFLDEVHAQHEKQRTYKSKHQHSPEKFNLDPERIRRDLGFVYDAYDLERPQAEITDAQH
jgi:hypothetical protein